jgi:hypothetical protein
MLAGKWTYRSFHNNPAPVGDDPNKALNLIFAEAVFAFEIPSSTALKGTIDWPGGGLDLQGTIRANSGGARPQWRSSVRGGRARRLKVGNTTIKGN